MKHACRLHGLAWCGQPIVPVLIATAGVISLVGACVVTSPAPPPRHASSWGPPGAPAEHPGEDGEGYYEGQEYAGEDGEGYYEGQEYAGEDGEGYYEGQEYAGEDGEGYYEGQEYAGEDGEGYGEEEHADEAAHGEGEGHAGSGQAPAPGHAAPGDSPNPSALERGIVEQINWMRRNPRDFAQALQRFRGHYRGQLLHLPGSDVPIQTVEGVAAVDEAIRVARQTRSLPPMGLSVGLSRAAREHAREIGAAGTLDHAGADGSSPFDRMRRHGEVQGMAGENIGTGYEDPAQVVIDLFVDDGVPSRGHRQNLLTSEYRVVGVGCAPHRLYGTVCVLNFAEGFVAR